MAALGSPVRRAVAPRYSSRTTGPLKRRLVVGLLVLASLAMITVYFRESPNGGLHDFQSAGASVLRPFEIAADRIAQPVPGRLPLDGRPLSRARGERGAPHEDLSNARQQAIQQRERRRGGREAPRHPQVQARADLSRGLPELRHGERHLEPGEPVRPDRRHRRGPHQRHPRLRRRRHRRRPRRPGDEGDPRPGQGHAPDRQGERGHGEGPPDRRHRHRPPQPGLGRRPLPRPRREEQASPGGTTSSSPPASSRGSCRRSIPKGIPIGVVTKVGQTDIDAFQNVQVMPLVDFSSLEAVIVLVSDKPRPQMP